MLRKIFGPLKESGIWNFCFNHELMDLHSQTYYLRNQKRKITKVRTCGMNSNEITAKKMFKDIPEGRRSFVKPRKRWLDDVENDLKKMDVRGWKKIARDRDD